MSPAPVDGKVPRVAWDLYAGKDGKCTMILRRPQLHVVHTLYVRSEQEATDRTRELMGRRWRFWQRAGGVLFAVVVGAAYKVLLNHGHDWWAANALLLGAIMLRHIHSPLRVPRWRGAGNEPGPEKVP